jgi:general secretion pathway protein C
MLSRFAAFVIWAAVAGCAVFWAMRLLPSPIDVPAHATLVSTADASKGDLARLFGSSAATPVVSTAAPEVPSDPRFQLIGVVAPRSPAARGEGLAVIAFDGKPPRAYRVGMRVDGELMLQAVRARGVSLGPLGEPPQVDLELPLLPPPTTGVPGMGLPPPPPGDPSMPQDQAESPQPGLPSPPIQQAPMQPPIQPSMQPPPMAQPPQSGQPGVAPRNSARRAAPV